MSRDLQYVGLGIESTYNTEVAASVYCEAVRVTPREPKTIEFQNTIASSYVRGANLTEEFGAVDFEWYTSSEDILGYVLKCLLGEPTSAVITGTAYSHIYKTDDTLYSFTLLEGDTDVTEIPFTGQVMSALTIGSTPGGFLLCSATSYGNKPAALNALAGSPTFDTTVDLRHKDLTVTIDSTDKSQYVGAVSCRIMNNPEEGKTTAGGTGLQNMPRHQLRAVEFTIELARYDSALYTAFQAGSTVDIDLSWTGADIETGHPYTVQIYASKVYLTNYERARTGREYPVHRITGRAIYDATDASEVVVRIDNTDTDY